MKIRDRVYLLWHTHGADVVDEDVKLVGVYSSRGAAERAQARAVAQPGFRENPSGFEIDEYVVDKDCWTEGFVTLIGIRVPSSTGPLQRASAVQRPGDLFELVSIDDPASSEFVVGDVVRCKRRTFDGIADVLVAEERVNEDA